MGAKRTTAKGLAEASESYIYIYIYIYIYVLEYTYPRQPSPFGALQIVNTHV